MTDALVGAVVGVDEPLLPVTGQRLAVEGVAVILARDETTLGAEFVAGLILTAVTEFQLVGFAPRRPTQKLEADIDLSESCIKLELKGLKPLSTGSSSFREVLFAQHQADQIHKLAAAKVIGLTEVQRAMNGLPDARSAFST